MKAFKFSTWFVLLSLLFGSGVSQAVIIDVDYEGTIYVVEGDGLEYSVGDSISGSLYINSDRAPTDEHPDLPSIGTYYSWSGVDGFVTGYLPNDAGHEDWIRIFDQYRGGDGFEISDSSGHYVDDGQGTYSGNTAGVFFVASEVKTKGSVLEFISGDGLEQDFDLTDAAPPRRFYGQIWQGSWEYVDYQEVFDIWNVASFNLTSLSVRAHVGVPNPCTECVGPTAAVHETPTLALFGLGLVGAGFARRRRSH